MSSKEWIFTIIYMTVYFAAKIIIYEEDEEKKKRKFTKGKR
jgi:hypothetical protein